MNASYIPLKINPAYNNRKKNCKWRMLITYEFYVKTKEILPNNVVLYDLEMWRIYNE